MGTSGLGIWSISGRNRVPSPAPRTNACLINAMPKERVRHRGLSQAKNFAQSRLQIARDRVDSISRSEFLSCAVGPWVSIAGCEIILARGNPAIRRFWILDFGFRIFIF